MNILNITVLELKSYLRNRVSFSLVLIMPIAMILLMGTVMKPTFEAVDNEIEQIPLLYWNGDEGPAGMSFDSLLREGSSKLLKLVEMPVEDIEKAVASGEYAAAVIIPEDFSGNVMENKKASIQIIGSGKHPVEESVVQAVINGIILWSNTQKALDETIFELGSEDGATDTAHALQQVNLQHGNNFIKEQGSEDNFGLGLTSYQFFSASMLVFFLLTSGMGIGSSLIDDRKNKTFKRIHSFPVQKREYFMGKIFGNGAIAIFQAISIIVITHFAFGVDWGRNFIGIFITFMLIIFISCAFGIIFSNIVNSSGTLTASLTIIFWFMSFISGGFTGTPVLGLVSKLTVNHWGFNSISTLMSGGNLKEVADSMIILGISALVLWSIGLALNNRRVSYE